ncbi:hypothetical protein SAY86_020588 [Trapa natans]|uniref:Pectinesterase n=1 Tax=Trapa natans TaxID=22666 RepID=A0AAN7LQR5_TRANT|nr:hypothetical protein SAY86_020588 [Trapa natans]
MPCLPNPSIILQPSYTSPTMASCTSKLLPLLLLLILSSLLSFLLPSSAIPESPGSICKSTPDPRYCRSVLPTHNFSADGYFYGRYSVRKSLSVARKFLNLVDKYLTKRPSLTLAAVRALEDCRLLAALNLDFLSASFQTVNSTSRTLPALTADDVQTLLSAILTNVQTCIDGLREASPAWSLRMGIAAPLSNDTKLYSVSLALFNKVWVPRGKKRSSVAAAAAPALGSPSAWLTSATSRKKRFAFGHGQLALTMPGKVRSIYEAARTKHLRRHLLQSSEEDGGNAVMVSDIVVVSQDGSGNFTTINDAISNAPNNSKSSDGYFLIYVTAGVYEEYVSIAKNKRYLMMIGDGINQTVITGNHSVVDGWTTFNSATFAVVAPNFVAAGITFRNTAGAVKHQAVAVRNGADLSTFYSCSFEGYQDTLYAHSLRQFYRECDIYGTVDFIFGNAAVVFQGCNLYPRLPMRGQFNAITAQGRTDPNQNTGTSIHGCTVVPADELASSNMTVRTYLGRPWKEYSRTVYMQSYIDGSVNPAGWMDWNGTFALTTLYYAEYNNTGEGSDTASRVTWAGYHVINATDAANFTVSNFLLGNDWLPMTGVPYDAGLL